MREYLTYAIPQRLLHLLSDRCPWADLQLVEHGSRCAEFEAAAIIPGQGEFCLIFTANEKGLFLPAGAVAALTGDSEAL